jgi:hypothetical protein
VRIARTLLATLAAFVAILAVDASAQTFYYKWVDKDGRLQFSDKPPAGFKGEVTKVAVDAMSDPVPPRAKPAPAAAPKALIDEEEKAPDMATTRRKNREQLAARVAQARAQLEAAKKALSDGEPATEDERQFVRQNFARSEKSPGSTPPPRQNCMPDRASTGQATWNCPRPIPNEAYFDRQKKLEEDVRKAEDELTEAERAYRRGTD